MSSVPLEPKAARSFDLIEGDLDRELARLNDLCSRFQDIRVRFMGERPSSEGLVSEESDIPNGLIERVSRRRDTLGSMLSRLEEEATILESV